MFNHDFILQTVAIIKNEFKARAETKSDMQFNDCVTYYLAMLVMEQVYKDLCDVYKLGDIFR